MGWSSSVPVPRCTAVPPVPHHAAADGLALDDTSFMLGQLVEPPSISIVHGAPPGRASASHRVLIVC
jgi:hypothetical protein